MKFLIYSDHGSACGLAWKLKQEKVEVVLYLKEKNAKKMLDGIVEKTDSFMSSVGKLDKTKDIIIFDMVGEGALGDNLKKMGYNVLFSSKFADRLELDRGHAINIAKNAGIFVPEHYEFKESEKALKFLQNNDSKWVLKPYLNKPPSFTAVLNGSKQAINHIKWLKLHGLYKEGEEFMIQKFIDGIELSTELWFLNGHPVYPANSTIETKKFLAGDLGSTTGCQTSLIWHYKEKEPRIIGQTLKKLYILFEAVKYTGPIDINCIIEYSKQRAYFLEFTPRMGYNAIFGLCELLEIPLNEFLMELAFGNTDEMPVSGDSFGSVLRVSIPPYPLGIENEKDYLKDSLLSEGKLIEFKGDLEGLYISDVKKEDKEFYTSGADGYILDIARKADSIEQAEQKAIFKFDEINLLDKQARIEDGFERAKRDFIWLESARFVTGRKKIYDRPTAQAPLLA